MTTRPTMLNTSDYQSLSSGNSVVDQKECFPILADFSPRAGGNKLHSPHPDHLSQRPSNSALLIQ